MVYAQNIRFPRKMIHFLDNPLFQGKYSIKFLDILIRIWFFFGWNPKRNFNTRNPCHVRMFRVHGSYGCFLKWWVKTPPNHPFVNRVFHYFHHPFWGYPYFWKHSYLSSFSQKKDAAGSFSLKKTWLDTAWNWQFPPWESAWNPRRNCKTSNHWLASA